MQLRRWREELPRVRHSRRTWEEHGAAVAMALSHKTRVLLALLLTDRERNAGELCEVLGISQSLVSQHLKLLLRAELVRRRRESRQMFYSLRPGIQQALWSLLDASEAELID